MSETGVERRLTTILAADVVGYSRLMAADEAGTHAKLKSLRNDLIEPTTAEYHGRVVKLMGDGILMEFASVIDAVNFAVIIQRAMAASNDDVPDEERIDFRIGINIGDIIVDGEDIYGDGVNVASRLEGLADAGGICISAGVYDQVHNRINEQIEDLGERQVKNINRPVKVYRIVLGGIKPSKKGLAALGLTTNRPPNVTRKNAVAAVLPMTTLVFAVAFLVFVPRLNPSLLEYHADSDRIVAETRAALTNRAVESVNHALALRIRDIDELRAQLKSTNEAIVTLAKQEDPGINAALEALVNGDRSEAKRIFLQSIKRQNKNVQEIAKLYRHLGALEFLDNTDNALNAYRRAVELDPKNFDGLNRLGRLLHRIGKYDAAIDAFRRAVALAEAQHNQDERAIGLGNLGRVYWTWEELDQAISKYQEALVTNKNAKPTKGMAINYSNLGNVYRIRDQFEKSVAMHKISLKINETLHDEEGIARNYGDLGNVYLAHDELGIAEEMYTKALSINQDLKRKVGIAGNYTNLGTVYWKRGEFIRAVEKYEQSLAIYDELGHTEGVAGNYGNLGNVYWSLGDYSLAESMYLKSLMINEKLGHKINMAVNYDNLGNVHMKLGNFSEAKRDWEQSVQLYIQINSPNAEFVKDKLNLLSEVQGN